MKAVTLLVILVALAIGEYYYLKSDAKLEAQLEDTVDNSMSAAKH